MRHTSAITAKIAAGMESLKKAAGDVQKLPDAIRETCAAAKEANMSAERAEMLDEKVTAACEVVKKLNVIKDIFTVLTYGTNHVMGVEAHVSSTLQKVSAAEGDTQERFHELLSDGSMPDAAEQRSDDGEHTPSVQKKQEQVEGKLGGGAENDGVEFAAVRAADHAAATIRATVENAAGNATETLRQITSHAACAVNKAGASRRNERKTFEDEKAALAVIIRSAEDYAKEIESMAAKLGSAAQGLLSDLRSSISVLQKREQDLVYNAVLGKNHTSSGAHDMKKQHALVLGDAALRDEKDQTAAVSLAEELQKTASANIALGAPCGQSIEKQVPVLNKEAQDSETRGMRYGSLLATVARVLISEASERHAEAMDLVRLRKRTQAIQNEIYAEQASIARVAETLRRIQKEAFAKQLTLIMRAICSHPEKIKSLNERSAKLTDEAAEMETRASEIYRQNAPTTPPRAKQSEQYAKVTSLLASANARIGMTKTELSALSKQSSDGSGIERKERNSKQGAVPAGKNTLLGNLNKTAWEVLARVTFKRVQEANEGICKSTQLNEIVGQLTNSHAATTAANETEDAVRRIFAVLGRHLHHAKNTLKHAFEAKN
ncbi:hypothetical protein, conserved in T. vivax [Trypanosoma vivax Y486]|uniref:Uncharacterized protein n=1 Tax=Trypanosoma vivax (strain Y486) TaxID=1055687 RepID=F9WKW4_TRYVY|nr:hypothetical protein, conserved in T. vivax [Trypanosoma vivax Y486]|eukprot:CCD18146.1 hypothetical protein, conserved in T. vivax [Trypanosoma vivax Y486]